MRAASRIVRIYEATRDYLYENFVLSSITFAARWT